MRVAKTKALISFCVFVFAYAKSRFSHDASHIDAGTVSSVRYNFGSHRTGQTGGSKIIPYVY